MKKSLEKIMKSKLSNRSILPIIPILSILFFSFQELNHALDTISEQSHQVKLLEFQPKVNPSSSLDPPTKFHLGC